MGFCDVSGVVIPKVGFLAEPGGAGDIRSWYLTLHELHTSHAVTGAICVAAAAVLMAPSLTAWRDPVMPTPEMSSSNILLAKF